MKTIKFYYLFILIFLVSCMPEPIDIEVEPQDPKLTVSSYVIPGDIMIVSLTRSFSALSDSKEGDSLKNDFVSTVLVVNAQVTISYLGQTDTLFMIAPGIYASATILQHQYGMYTLEAKDPLSGEKISASTQMLPKVSLKELLVTVNRPDTTVNIKFNFDDVPGVDNWYIINYYLKTSGSSNHDINSFFNRGSNTLLSEFELVSDKEFDNGIFTKETVLHHVKATDSLAITLSNISEEYFKFLTAYKRSGSFFNQATGEPINYPSNVENGFGFFNAYIPDVRFIDLNQIPKF